MVPVHFYWSAQYTRSAGAQPDRPTRTASVPQTVPVRMCSTTLKWLFVTPTTCPPHAGHTRPDPPGGVGPYVRAGVDGLWIRQHGLLPTPGLIIDHAVIRPFNLAGLGLIPVRQRPTLTAPVPTLSHLAIDLTEPRAATMTYRIHPDDAETPLAHGLFVDDHPTAWSTALANHTQVLLTVTHCAPILAARTPDATIGALDNAWTAIIACNNACVGRSHPTLTSPCNRHPTHHSDKCQQTSRPV